MENVISLLPWELTVRRAVTRSRAHELVDQKDADQAIRALSELEAYYVIKEVGLEASLPILAVLEPHQITALFDLDIWHDDRVDLDDLTVWLSTFREAGTPALARAAAALDPELFALFLRRRLLIALAPTDDTPEHEIPQWLQSPPPDLEPLIHTPDRRFIIAARPIDELDDDSLEDSSGAGPKLIDEDDRKAILELVDTLYKEDYERVAQALRLADADFSTSLEEAAHQFRTARLEDLGFPPLARAIEIYAPLAPGAALPKPEPKALGDVVLPAIHAERFAHGFFQDALRTIESTEVVRRIEGELVPLANSALVADRVEPGDLEGMKRVLERLRAYLEIALSHGTEPGQRIEVARKRLESLPIRTLFRAGFGATLELQTRARRLKASRSFLAGSDRLGLLSEPDRAVIDALLETRPMYAGVLDGPDHPTDQRRPFGSAEDVDRAARRLDELEALARAAQALTLSATNEALSGAIDPPLSDERSADMLLTTAAANALLERGFVVRPLEKEDLRRLQALLATASPSEPERARTFSADRVRAAVEAGVARAEARPAGALLARRIEEGIRGLAEALGSLSGSGEIDPRFIGLVVRRLG